MATQFEILGKETDEADRLAMQLLARSQGAATVASAFQDEQFLYQEAEALKQWLAAVI